MANTEATFNRESVVADLNEKGYAVIPGILTDEECDEYFSQYREWLDRCVESNPSQNAGLIHHFSVSHSDANWRIRLRAKHVFSSLWGTEKLLTSFDGIALVEPPELGDTGFNEGRTWYHIDQGSWRQGVHAYQGAVYLKETTDTDGCFRVIVGSSRYHDEFFKVFPEAATEAANNDFYPLDDKYIDWFKTKGCKETKIPVPKGGIVLWDSRTIHDSVKPEKNRDYSDRWRCCVFICMVPAVRASEEDLKYKTVACKKMVATAHWPSQGVSLFPSSVDCGFDKIYPEMITKQPEVFNTPEVRLLAGIDCYDFDDGKPNDLGWKPSWSVDITKKKLPREV